MAEAQILDQLKKVKAEMVVLCHPNNPTGHCYSEDFIAQLVKNQKVQKGYVLVDESFRFFEDIVSCYKKDEWNLIVLTSLTKYYGIPGLRIGYMTGNHSLIETMKKSQMPWTLNGLALTVTKDLMDNQGLKEATTAWYNSEKIYINNALSDLKGLEVLKSTTNYVLCFMDEFLGTEINQWLLAQSEPMGIRECGDFGGLSDSYIRIGLKSHEDNEKLIHQLEEYWRLNNG
jgi:threonine-phosphate decarboxylase